KPIRKVTQVTQPSDPMEHVAVEVVHKELEAQLHARVDSKKIIITEASIRRDLQLADEEGVDCLPNSTIFEQLALMGVNIAKTQSKATPNDSSSQGTDSGGGPRVESSDDEENLGEGTSKQGRIEAIDADEDITLVNDQDNVDKDIFDVNVLGGEEMFTTAGKTKNPKKKNQIRLDKEAAKRLQVEFDKEERLATEGTKKEQEANITLIETWDDIQVMIDADYQLAKKMQAQEQEEMSNAEKATLFYQLLGKRRKHFAAKRVEEKRNKPSAQAQKRKIMCSYLKDMEGYKLKDLTLKEFDKIQEMFDREFRRVNT
nr:hypothetical protein [Tanacetum cinerariifolium]